MRDQLVSRNVQDVTADRALEFLDHRGLQALNAATRHRQTVGLEMRFVAQADEVRDEAKASLAFLKLAKEDIVEPRAHLEIGQVPNIARLTQRMGVANHRQAVGIELGQTLDDEVRKAGHQAIVFRQAGFIVEDRYADERGLNQWRDRQFRRAEIQGETDRNRQCQDAAP